MNYYLVVFEIPLTGGLSEYVRLGSIIKDLNEIANSITDVKIEILAENCLLLPRESGLNALCKIKSTADNAGLRYKTVLVSRPLESTIPTASSPSPL